MPGRSAIHSITAWMPADNMEFLLILMGILALWILTPRESQRESKTSGWRNGTIYAVFVALLAFSPLIGGYFASKIGFEVNSWTAMCFIWVGVVLSLPTSLSIARLFGGQSYNDYWVYLESFPHSSKRNVIILWASASIFAFLIGTLGLLFLR